MPGAAPLGLPRGHLGTGGRGVEDARARLGVTAQVGPPRPQVCAGRPTPGPAAGSALLTPPLIIWPF